jgi:hypothetical protein
MSDVLTLSAGDKEKARKAKTAKPRKPRAKKGETAAKANGGRRVGGFREGGTPAEIVEVLKAAGGPLNVKEITERVMKRGRANLKGQTPEATVAAMLSVSVRKEDSPFKKTDRGTFALK